MNSTSVRSRADLRRPVRVLAGVSAVVLLGGLAACSGDNAEPVAVASTPAVTTTPPPPPPASPFTGEPLKDGKPQPVLVVKVDNSPSSLPHVGVSDADIVYVEQVEGGITRLVSVFSSTLPETVVPVRSARETDAELLPQFGKVPVAFSGAVSSVHSLVQGAGLQDISEDVGGEGYFRISGRYAPYNLAGTPKTLIKRAKKVLAKDVGLTFGPLPAGGKPAGELTAQYSGSTIGFEYNAKKNAYLYSLGGRADQVPGEAQVSARTVVVQSVAVGTANRGDATGSNVPHMRTIGSGKARVLRDGKAFTVKWERKKANGPTRFTRKGVDFPMGVGNVWVVLFPNDRTPLIEAGDVAATPKAGGATRSGVATPSGGSTASAS